MKNRENNHRGSSNLKWNGGLSQPIKVKKIGLRLIANQESFIDFKRNLKVYPIQNYTF